MDAAVTSFLDQLPLAAAKQSLLAVPILVVPYLAAKSSVQDLLLAVNS
jgi:hypothetical protein